MDYNDIKTAAYAYADRTDTETLDRYDDFLRIVESKINRVLKTLKLTSRAAIPSVVDQNYYGLPVDFDGMIDLRVTGTNINGNEETITCEYRTPSAINNNKNIPVITSAVYYNIIADQLYISPSQENNTIEMTYYKRVNELTPTVLTNWISDLNPDCYIFGVLTEINAFTKDAETATLWDTRFNQSLSEIMNNDDDVRWDSGTALQIKRV